MQNTLTAANQYTSQQVANEAQVRQQGDANTLTELNRELGIKSEETS